MTNPKIKNAAVTSAKVANRSLLRADFAPGQLPRSRPGLPDRGPAAAWSERPGASRGHEPDEFVGDLNRVHAVPGRKRLIGGGARLNGSILDNVAIQLSYPGDDNTYVARAAEVATNAGNWSLTVFAVCGTAG